MDAQDRIAEDKAAERKAAFARRAAAKSAAADHAANTRLAEALAPHADRPLSGFLPIGSEIDPRPTMSAWSGPVGVPLIEAKAQPLAFALWTPDAVLVKGVFGTSTPENPVRMEPEVLIVPLLSFDRKGFRLGYGGGFYDRTLEMLRQRRPTVAIGFAFAAQEVESVPVEPVDQPLDMIVTEREIIRTAPTTPPSLRFNRVAASPVP